MVSKGLIVVSIFLFFFLPLSGQGIEWKLYPVLQDYFEKNHVQEIEPLTGGKSFDQLFVIKTANQKHVLRIINKKRSWSKRNLIFEATRLIGEKELGPKVIWCDHDREFLITEFIEGQPLKKHDLQDHRVLKSLAHGLRHAHDSLRSLGSSNKIYSLKERTLQRLKECATYSRDEWITPLSEKINSIFVPTPSFVVHSDLKADNILIKNKKLFIIDWGEADYGNIYDDLGSIAFHFELIPPQQQELIYLYFGSSPTKQNMELLALYSWLARINDKLLNLREKLKQSLLAIKK